MSFQFQSSEVKGKRRGSHWRWKGGGRRAGRGGGVEWNEDVREKGVKGRGRSKLGVGKVGEQRLDKRK